MRKTALALIIVLTGDLLISCIDGGNTEYMKYQLLNSSDYEIKLEVYTHSLGMLNQTISLESNGGEWNSPLQDVTRGTEFHPEDEEALNGDSLRVEFDDSRVLVFVLWDYSRQGPFSVLNRKIIKESKTLDIQRFTFTNEDYESAEEIVPE